ncbi:peptidase family M1-domain-containing protein [Cerioporus squamosus]|nr:peptidase family M1-domain-containing protein [Cerioporus squamosus]
MPETTAPRQDYRLPTDVTPTHYDLEIWTDLRNLKFDGSVDIHLRVNRETSKVVLNSLYLDLDHVLLQSDALHALQEPCSREFDADQQRVVFTFTEALPADSAARLTISFKAAITGHLMGYYKSTGGADGKTIYALTQFQPTAARRAFPCWDEPAVKATFAITMVSRKDTVNISNMPAESEGPYDPTSVDQGSWLGQKFASLADASEWKVTRFQTTPPMSTYIVAYANGPFEFVEGSYTSPLSGKVRPLRFYGVYPHAYLMHLFNTAITVTADCIPHAQFALSTMEKVMPIYERMFDLEYPLPKLDLLAASDFDLGGMENWGLIVGRTQYLLHDPESNDIQNEQSVASMVGHEVAHMWFGDITTMEWWDNLYLNEGFATLMGDKVILALIEKIWPEWKSDSEFLVTSYYSARSLDAKLSSHPIEVECPDPSKILQIFDALSYAKAGSVLRMLSSYVGEERFLKGVSLYLKKHQYNNTVTKDLWEGIQLATGLDIPKMMDNWVKKMGYPVITVTESEGGVHIRQDRFLESGPAGPKDNETLWTVPLNIVICAADGKPSVNKVLLEEREKLIPLETSKPFKLNADTTGFYTVKYSAERLAKLGKQATSPSSPFSLSDRIGLVWDAFSLARAGYTPLSSALGLVNTFNNETEYFVWNTIATNLSIIASTWYEHPRVLELLNPFQRDLFVPIVKRLGFESSPNDSPNDKQLRTKAIEQAADAGDTGVVGELKSRFAHFLGTGDDSNISTDLARVTYRIAVQEGGKREWERVKALAVQPKTPAQGMAAMLALGATQDLALAEATLQFMVGEARDQDGLFVARGLQSNPKTRKFLARRTREEFDRLEQKYSGTFNMARWIERSFQQLASEEDYEETAAFFKDRDTSQYDLALKQTLDNIRARAAWIKRSTDELVQWLEQRPKA